MSRSHDGKYRWFLIADYVETGASLKMRENPTRFLIGTQGLYVYIHIYCKIQLAYPVLFFLFFFQLLTGHLVLFNLLSSFLLINLLFLSIIHEQAFWECLKLFYSGPKQRDFSCKPTTRISCIHLVAQKVLIWISTVLSNLKMLKNKPFDPAF